MAKDITGISIATGDTVAYIRKPWKGNQKLKLGKVLKVNPKSVTVDEPERFDGTYTVIEGRFILYEAVNHPIK